MPVTYDQAIGYDEPVGYNGLTEGSYEAPGIDLSTVGVVSSSRISWTENAGAGTTVTVQTRISSAAGLTDWQTATNGGAIPGMYVGRNVQGESLLVRVLFAAELGSTPPSVEGLSIALEPDPGLIEYAPLGVFGIASATVVDEGRGVLIQVEGYDRARKVQRARFVDPYVIAAGTNYATAIRDLVANRLPGTTFNFMVTSRVTPLLVLGLERDHDPWKDAQDMASSLGAELFFDADGVCVLRPEPDPATAPVVWDYVAGEDATLLGVQRAVTNETAYNHVVVTGESTSNAAPVRGEAVDDEPSSATYYLGDFGDVPYFVTSRYVTTSDQATEAAAAILRRVKTLTEQVDFPAVVNPAHEAGDVVRIRRSQAGVDDLYVLESFDVPLSYGEPMTATTRKRRA